MAGKGGNNALRLAKEACQYDCLVVSKTLMASRVDCLKQVTAYLATGNMTDLKLLEEVDWKPLSEAVFPHVSECGRADYEKRPAFMEGCRNEDGLR